jgi:hypothetical protein
MNALTTRGTIGLLTFVVGTTFCVLWSYGWLLTTLSTMAESSGGIGAVSLGLAELAAELLVIIVPIIITFRLTRLAGSTKLAVAWRSAHVATAVALVAVAVVNGIFVKMVVLSIFFPMQVFFANGALAIWIANPVRSA